MSKYYQTDRRRVAKGFEVMYTMMEADVEALCRPKGRHDPARGAYRHGTDDGEVCLGGRRVAVRRPPVRSADGKKELPLPTYEAFSSAKLLRSLTLEKMTAKLSARRYRSGDHPHQLVSRDVADDRDVGAGGTGRAVLGQRLQCFAVPGVAHHR